MTVVSFKPQPQLKRSDITQIILGLILAAKESENKLITHAEFEAATSLPITELQTSAIPAARRAALHEHNIVIASDRGVGYRVVEGADALTSSSRILKHTGKQARTGARVLNSVNFTQLSQDGRETWLVQNTGLQFVKHGSETATRKNSRWNALAKRQHNSPPEEQFASMLDCARKLFGK